MFAQIHGAQMRRLAVRPMVPMNVLHLGESIDASPGRFQHELAMGGSGSELSGRADSNGFQWVPCQFHAIPAPGLSPCHEEQHISTLRDGPKDTKSY